MTKHKTTKGKPTKMGKIALGKLATKSINQQVSGDFFWSNFCAGGKKYQVNGK
jgi:hypothetical protein